MEENIKAVGKNITRKKVKGKNIIFPMILRLLGRISSGKEGKGIVLGKKSRLTKLGVGKNINL